MSQARPTETSKSTGFGLKTPQRSSEFSMPLTSVHKVETDGVRVFYRAAGDQNSPIVLLLHGFSASSFMFRELIPGLANEYRVITPDLPGFGFTEVPAQQNTSIRSTDWRRRSMRSCKRSKSGTLHCTCSTTAHQPDSVWRWLIRIEYQRSSVRATKTSNWICFSITQRTSSSIRRFRTTFARRSRHC
jgi:hypothetical protein